MLAESVMFDATRMVAILDSIRHPVPAENLAAEQQQADVVSIKAVLRVGAAVTGTFAVVCGLGNILSGTMLLHPLIAVLLVVGSIGFYLMSFLPRS